MPDSTFWISMAVLGLVSYTSMVHGQSQDRIARLERKLDALLRHFDIEATQRPSVSDRVKDLARDPSKKIEAIKAYRQESGVGLAEAKVAVETFINEQ